MPAPLLFALHHIWRLLAFVRLFAVPEGYACKVLVEGQDYHVPIRQALWHVLFARRSQNNWLELQVRVSVLTCLRTTLSASHALCMAFLQIRLGR